MAFVSQNAYEYLTLWSYKMASLGDTVAKGKQIADSSAVGLIFKASMIVACGMIVYFSKGSYEKLQQHDQQLTHVSDTTDALKADMASIKQQDGQDHDWLTMLRTEVEGPNGLIVSVAKLWQRPAPSNRQPQPQ